MRKEMLYAGRVLSLICHRKESEGTMKYFMDILKDYKRDIKEIIKEYNIPQQVIIYFKESGGELDGFYHVQSPLVSKYIIAIEIYTDKWDGMTKREIKKIRPEMELLDTFIHELIHHRYYNERETLKRTGEIMGRIEARKVKELI